MIDQESIRIVGESRFGERFRKPLYEGYAFAQLPQTVRSLLTDDRRRGVPFAREDYYDKYDTVVLFFIDCFGWRFVEKFLEHPFLKRIADNGLVAKISSQFPSTTAAHVTTIHTGVPIGQSGVYEWYYYEPSLDAVISPLMFSFAGDQQRETLLNVGADPLRLFPTDTVYYDLSNHGVSSYVLQDHNYTHSAYTSVVTKGAQLLPYRSMPEAMVTLDELLQNQKGRAYYFFYYDKIDSVGHYQGPLRRHMDAEIETTLWMLEKFLQPALEKAKGKTLFLMTADHANIDIDPATTVYLNESLKDLLPMIRRNKMGQYIAPCGSSRDMFIHVKEGCIDPATEMLRHHLHGKAEVHRTDDLIHKGFFGTSPPSAAFLSRIGDIVVLPYASESVWWYEEGRFEQKMYGNHGGLTPEEMETVILAQRYGS